MGSGRGAAFPPSITAGAPNIVRRAAIESPTKDMEEERLREFGRHCRSFYESSLILSTSSSSLSSMKEEKTEDEEAVRIGDMKRRAADGRAVIEALDRIGSLRSLSSSLRRLPPSKRNVASGLQSSLADLLREHELAAERHRLILDDCGLLDLFAVAARDDGETGRLLQKYAETRDSSRRQAHKLSMRHRQHSMSELLSRADSTGADPSGFPDRHMTQLKHVQSAISIIQTFAKKYRSNVGSHPFLAGLHRVVDLQSNPESGGRRAGGDPSRIVRWKFLGSALTEACRSRDAGGDRNADDELAYARDAIRVLFSFMVRVEDDDAEKRSNAPSGRNDAESDRTPGSADRCDDFLSGECPEPVLIFEVDKRLSDANLRRILAAIPGPERLDARATGSVEIVHGSEVAIGAKFGGPVPRSNVDGLDDEPWPWFARIQFCNLL